MYSYIARATIVCSYMVLPYAGQSQRDGKFENSLNFKIFFDLHRSPVSREQIWLGAPFLFCVRYVPVAANPINGKVWECMLQPH